MSNTATQDTTVTIAANEAVLYINEHGGYGTVRVYAEIQFPNDPHSQLIGIKSLSSVERWEEDPSLIRFFAKSNNGKYPTIRKA